VGDRVEIRRYRAQARPARQPATPDREQLPQYDRRRAVVGAEHEAVGRRLPPRLVDDCAHGLEDGVGTFEGDPVPTVMDDDEAPPR
jgi:hypothetical protein